MCVVISREVFAGNFFQREETVAFSTVIDKCRFEAGFNTGDFTFVDIGFFLLVSGAFDIQIVQTLAVNKGNALLFLLRCVN